MFIVRLPARPLQLFEATMDGVELFNLNVALKAYSSHSKLGIRRLNMERSFEMLEELNAFVKEVKGRPYKK